MSRIGFCRACALVLVALVPGAALGETPAETSSNTTPEASQVTLEDVDERIEAFERSIVSGFLLSGYGTAFVAIPEDEADLFGIGFNPGFHYRMTDRLHFNGELEIELETEDGEVETHIELEFAQVDVLATDWLVLGAGKFFTPFATFGTRLHPTWINKLASPPPIYGGHAGGGVIPVLTTVGGVASGGAALWSDDAKVNYAVYIGNGPTAESNPDDPEEVLDIEFDNSPDLDSIGTGGRVGFLPIANLEVGASYFTGDPDNEWFHMTGVDAWYFCEGLELRGEFVYLTREADGIDADVAGYWTQASYRLRYLFPDRSGLSGIANRMEPVVRWGQVFGFEESDREQVAFGLNFWLFESAPLKVTYELNSGAVKDNRFFVQFAYGF